MVWYCVTFISKQGLQHNPNPRPNDYQSCATFLLTSKITPSGSDEKTFSSANDFQWNTAILLTKKIMLNINSMYFIHDPPQLSSAIFFQFFCDPSFCFLFYKYLTNKCWKTKSVTGKSVVCGFLCQWLLLDSFFFWKRGIPKGIIGWKRCILWSLAKNLSILGVSNEPPGQRQDTGPGILWSVHRWTRKERTAHLIRLIFTKTGWAWHVTIYCSTTEAPLSLA